MKLLMKLMLVALVIALLLPFTLLKDRDGDTLMSFSDFELPSFSMPNISMPDLPKFSDSNKITPGDDNDLSGKDIFYKWYDAGGQVQFTTEPPPKGTEYVLIGFDPDANVIKSVTLPPAEAESDASSAEKNSDPDASVNPYSGDSVKKLLEDTRKIEKLLNQRIQEQNEAINQ